MSILLFGDSHTDLFFRMPNVVRFDASQCKSNVLTIQRFTDSTDSDLWNALDPWLKNSPKSSLIISVGEIDIRAHFWRHIPRHYKDSKSVLEYINLNVLNFYNSLVSTYEKYNLETIVVWGSPVAGDGASYNFMVPFSGSAPTRNLLIHLWNKSFTKIIKNNSRISFATAYYDFVDLTTYSVVMPSPSHDGVHWRDSYRHKFWEKLIMPALSGKSFVDSEHLDAMTEDNVFIADTVSSGMYQYDTWVCTDQIKESSGMKQTIINETSYSFITATQRKLLPEYYNELSLKKLNIK